uniref:Carboxylesterase type B domain-containing protein n=1 Tax=Panagrolaimus sp. ES5 TaxID=591445 RepID=A0AC34FFT4_9BILA
MPNAVPIVSTEYGDIEGFYYETSKDFKSDVFLGIPYAQPPINELRYEKPLPPLPWTSTLKAKEYGHQSATFKNMPVPDASEDSLTLNIMKPHQPPPPSSDPNGYPVMAFIHGGAFIAGSAANQNYADIVDRLVCHGIIVVTINYRLGPFGFFSTGDSDAPGNYGLWDQIEALKFIQKVIPAFNGNSKNVTIFGASAGAASVSWLTLAPAAKDFFSRAITMGGSAFASWAHSEEVVQHSMALANAAGCLSNAKKDSIKKCLKQKTTKEIIEAASSFIKAECRGDNINFGYFNPRFDNEIIAGTTMAEAVKNAPKKANFLGICSQEYISFVPQTFV